MHPLLGRFSVPRDCLFAVLFHTFTIVVLVTKVVLRLCTTPLLGHFSVPRDRLFVVLFDTLTIVVLATKVVLRLCIPLLNRFSAQVEEPGEPPEPAGDSKYSIDACRAMASQHGASRRVSHPWR